MKSRLKTITGILVGGLFALWFATRLDFPEVWAEVREANWRRLGLALSLLIGTYFVRVLRWRALLLPLANCSLGSLFRATVVGFSALFVMGRAGELIVRPAVLSVKGRVHPSASYATVMIERVFDMVMVVLLFAVNLIFFEYIPRDAEATRLYGWIKGVGVLLLAAAVAGVYGLSIFQRRRAGALAYLERRLGRLPRPLGRAVMSLLLHISEGLSVLRDARGLTVTLSYTAAMWLMVALTHLLVVRAFGVPYGDVPFTGAVFVMGLSMLGSVVPTPGGATGPFHTAAAGALVFLGVAGAKAASIAIVLHLVLFAPATLFGLYYIFKDGLSLGGLKRIGEQQAEEVDNTLGTLSAAGEREGEDVVAVRVCRRKDEMIKEFAEEGRL